MLAAQDGKCAICGRKPEPDAKRRFNIDHDHREMYIRGILCTRCNKWLWTFVDEEIIAHTLEYLKRGPAWFEQFKEED